MTRRLAAAGGVLAAFVVVGALVVTTGFWREGTSEFSDPGWDRHLYIAMAEATPFRFGVEPFNRRVLVPLVAGAFPGSIEAGFLAVAVGGAVAAVGGVWALGAANARTTASPILAVLLFGSLGWGLRYSLTDFWIPDGMVLALVSWGTWLAWRRSDPWLAALLLAGVFAKESVIFIAPLRYCLHARRLVDREAALRTAILVLPAVAALIGLRLGVPIRNGDEGYLASLPPVISGFPELYRSYDYGSLLRDIGWEQRFVHRDLATWRDYTLEPFGLLLPVLLLAAMKSQWRLALKLAPFFAAVASQLLFATDTERLLMLASPALCWLAARGAEAWLQSHSRLVWVPVAAAGLAFVSVCSGPTTFGSFGADLRVQAPLAGVTVIALMVPWRMRQRAP